MKLFVNATINPSGGGLHMAAEFIVSAVKYGGNHEWLFIVSPQINSNLTIESESNNYRKAIIPVSPARIISGRKSRKMIAHLEEDFRPDAVFTVIGVTYYKFKAPHLMQFALPWVTNPSRLAWSKLESIRKKLRMFLYCRYVEYWAQFADNWVLPTQIAADGLAKRLHRDSGLFHVVPNCCSIPYFEARVKDVSPHPVLNRRPKKEYRLLVFTSYIKHKNLESLPRTAFELKRLDPKRKYLFVLTFDKEIPAWKALQNEARKLKVGEYIINIGPQLVIQGPALYKSCNALFLPSVLEVFTATYPEAMCMRKPIITSNLDFARDICRDAAMYFNPLDPEDAAKTIIKVANNSNLVKRLVEAGDKRLKDFGTPKERFDMYMELIKETVSSKNWSRK